MTHSSLRSTLDVYTQAVGPAKRAARQRCFRCFFPPLKCNDAVNVPCLNRKI